MGELRKVFDGDESALRDWIEENAPEYSAYHAEDYDLNDLVFGLWNGQVWEGYIEVGDTIVIHDGVVDVESDLVYLESDEIDV
jgi:hypothetical protein